MPASWYRALYPMMTEIRAATESATELPRQSLHGSFGFFFVLFHMDAIV